MLPSINRDLAICDQVKIQNNLLKLDNKVLEDQATQFQAETVKAQKQTRTEKRKRKVINVVRTIIEISAVIILLTFT